MIQLIPRKRQDTLKNIRTNRLYFTGPFQQPPGAQYEYFKNEKSSLGKIKKNY